MRHILDLVQVCLCKLVVRRRKSDFGDNDGWEVIGSRRSRLLRLGRLLFSSRRLVLRVGFGSGGFGGGEWFNDGLGRFGRRSFLGLGRRLRNS